MISEHKRAAGMGDSQHATAVHWMKTSHIMDWEAAAVVVDRSSRWRQWRLKDRIHIRTRMSYNMDSEYLRVQCGTLHLGI